MIFRLLFLSLAFVIAACGQTTRASKAYYLERLTPENCISSEPDSLYLKHLREEGFSWDSEQARDNFHEAYAEVLAKRTDQVYPEATKFRKPVLEAFKLTFEFIRTANGHASTAHKMSRLPAEVEWNINCGFESKFDLGVSGEYTFDDIRILARLYQQSQRRFEDGRDLADIQKIYLEPALNQLKTAEQSMSQEAATYFRAKLFTLIAEYIGR